LFTGYHLVFSCLSYLFSSRYFPSPCTNVFFVFRKKIIAAIFCWLLGCQGDGIPSPAGKWAHMGGGRRTGFFCAHLSVVFSHYFGEFILNAFAFVSPPVCAVQLQWLDFYEYIHQRSSLTAPLANRTETFCCTRLGGKFKTLCGCACDCLFAQSEAFVLRCLCKLSMGFSKVVHYNDGRLSKNCSIAVEIRCPKSD